MCVYKNFLFCRKVKKKKIDREFERFDAEKDVTSVAKNESIDDVSKYGLKKKKNRTFLFLDRPQDKTVVGGIVSFNGWR